MELWSSQRALEDGRVQNAAQMCVVASPIWFAAAVLPGAYALILYASEGKYDLLPGPLQGAEGEIYSYICYMFWHLPKRQERVGLSITSFFSNFFFFLGHTEVFYGSRLTTRKIEYE